MAYGMTRFYGLISTNSKKLYKSFAISLAIVYQFFTFQTQNAYGPHNNH